MRSKKSWNPTGIGETKISCQPILFKKEEVNEKNENIVVKTKSEVTTCWCRFKKKKSLF